jgi:cystathionine gamma-synthase
VLVDATAATPVHLRRSSTAPTSSCTAPRSTSAAIPDVLLGVVVCREAETAERLREFRTRTGIVASPDAAWLLLRGLKTLETRVRRQTQTAQELVRRLEQHPRVETVRYQASADCSLSTSPETRGRSNRDASDRERHEPGGVESTMESRHRWEGDRVPVNLLRLSRGARGRRGALGRPRPGAAELTSNTR